MIDITSSSAVSVSGKHALQLLENARAVQSDGEHTYTANGSLQVSSANDTGALVASIIKLIMDAKGNTLLTIAATGGDSTAGARTGDGNDTIRMSVSKVTGIEAGGGNDYINATAEGGSEAYSAPYWEGISSVSGGDGNDTILLSSDGTVTSVSGGNGDDAMVITARYNALAIDGGDGHDMIRLDTGSVVALNGGDGNDHINLSARGTIHAVSGGKGDDTVIIDNQGKWAASYYYAIGDGQDTLSTNAAIEIHAFSETGTARYNIADARIERDGNVVTLSFGNDNDSLRIEFTGAMAEAEQYAFTYNAANGSLMIHDAATPASDLTTFVTSFTRPQSA